MLRPGGCDAYITGLGIYVPGKVVTNKDLEERLDTTDTWIRERTGIVTRHFVEDGQATSDLAIPAARMALEDAGVEPEEVDLVIVATFTEDYPFPSTASIVQAALGCTNAGAFDLETACTGWVAAASTGAMWVRGGGADTVLVIGADAASTVLNWNDRTTSVIFGDAASAAVIRSGEKCGHQGFKILSAFLRSDGNGLCHLYQPAGGSRQVATARTVAENLHSVHMAGRATYKFAVKAFADSAEVACEMAGLDVRRDIELVIPHQANARILEGAARRLDIPLEKLFINIDRYGNTVAASVGLALWEARQEGKLVPGNAAALIGMGAGLTWGGMAIRWVK